MEVETLVAGESEAEQWTYHPLSLPVDVNVVDSWVQAGVDVVSLVLREDDVSSVAALVKGLEDCWDVVGGVVFAGKDGACGAFMVVSDVDMLRCRLRYGGQK